MTTMATRRAWKGPAFLSYGFRPFFFGAAVLAAALIALWVPWFLGAIRIPSAFSPVDWHIHELLFGYVPAVIAGFLLTAVPNWTGRLPVVGWPLAMLFALWIAGRALVAFSGGVDPLVLALGALAFPVALAAVVAREIVAGKNWRNLKVLAVITLITLAQAIFHYEVWRFGKAGVGYRLGIAATVMLIALIGGRIVPSFTRNWIKRENPGREPAEFGVFDMVCMALGGVALAGWVASPEQAMLRFGIGLLLALAGIAHLQRLVRWAPDRTLGEALVAVLHVAYAFIPAGFILAGLALLTDRGGLETAAVHAWTSGGIGLMTMAVMTRATRGHSGQPLVASAGTVVVYAAIFAAALARIVVALVPQLTLVLLPLAGAAWVVGFAGFAGLYSRMLLRR